jgi:hypothetical protein
MKSEFSKSFTKRMNTWWRPLLAFQYIFVCLFDFVGGPIMYAVLISSKVVEFHSWTSLTLTGGVLGVTTWGRSQEKLELIKQEYTTPTPTPAPVKPKVAMAGDTESDEPEYRTT